ncbi:MAG: serine/threonine protein phosphatase [Bacteroidetes bacterium]|nr:MAG: serine/threonine protein phosphatase [Bacteroidota bacterium]
MALQTCQHTHLSPTMRKFAISDIHGCLKTFRALVEQQIQLTPQDELYLLGDYVDRGPDSKGVLDYIMNLQERGYQVKCLKGNHEVMLVEASRDPNEMAMWLYNGGQEALASFGTEDPAQIPSRYISFLDKLPIYYEVDEYILVHAGLNFVGEEGEAEEKKVKKKDKGAFLWRMHNPLKDEHAMMWIRWWYDDIDWHWLKDRVIVHGHTPIDEDEIWDMYEFLDEDQVLDIDNGCYAKHKPGLGKLCAFELMERKLFFQENID